MFLHFHTFSKPSRVMLCPCCDAMVDSCKLQRLMKNSFKARRAPAPVRHRPVRFGLTCSDIVTRFPKDAKRKTRKNVHTADMIAYSICLL
jgi:hypothetical protein